ncbi:MAG: MarR family transcriptional regulator, partial [Acidimicrobiales bacterium]
MSNEGADRSGVAQQVAPATLRDRQTLMRELRDALRAFLRAVDVFDEAVSERLGINRTDLRCLDLLEQHRPMTAGALAEASGITTGAMTFVLDRLEGAGFVRRQRDEGDRRRVLVDLEPEGADRAWSV